MKYNFFFHSPTTEISEIFFYLPKTETSKYSFIIVLFKKKLIRLLAKKHQSVFICESTLFSHVL